MHNANVFKLKFPQNVIDHSKFNVLVSIPLSCSYEYTDQLIYRINLE